MKKCLFTTILLTILILCLPIAADPTDTPCTIDLSGDWNFSLDPENIGEQEQWFSDTLPLIIKLPGSTTENGFGDDITVDTKWTGGFWNSAWFAEKKYEKYRQPGNIKISFWLQPTKHYVGPAWYQKNVVIPQNWKNKQITLFLERTHWETKAWVDGKYIGAKNSLSTPNRFELGSLNPGKHQIVLCVDNTVKIDVGRDAHSVSDNTQTNWNGIIGKMQLQAEDSVTIDDVQIYPDIKNKNAKVVVTVGNRFSKTLISHTRTDVYKSLLAGSIKAMTVNESWLYQSTSSLDIMPTVSDDNANVFKGWLSAG